MNDFHPGLEGVIAFETEIAEPDREGSALRYRGVDVEELVGRYPFEQVWGLLVDGRFEPGMPRGGADRAPGPERLGDGRPAGGARDARPEVGPRASSSTSRRGGARRSRPALGRGALDRRAGGARRRPRRCPSRRSAAGENAASQFLIRWRGEADPRHVTALDTYWVSAAEHGLNASTFTARIAASTGADCAAALLERGRRALRARCTAARRRGCCGCSTRSRRAATPTPTCSALLDRGERIMGFGHRVYRAEDPRARVLRRTARELGSPRVEVAEELERAALAALREKSPDRVLETNVEFWAAVVLDVAEIPPAMYPAMFGCARVAGWSAHIVEQRRTGRLIRPSARYVGAPAHSPARGVTLAEAAARGRRARRRGRRARARGAADAAGTTSSRRRRASRDFRERAVAYRAISQFRYRQKIELLRRGLEDESPACRGSAHRSRSRRSRATTRA